MHVQSLQGHDAAVFRRNRLRLVFSESCGKVQKKGSSYIRTHGTSAKKRGIIPRSWYSANRVLIAKNDRGESAFNSSEILGACCTGSLENAYYPQHDRGLDETMSRFASSLGSDAISNLLRQFWPDISRIFRKHEPKKLRTLEERIPLRKTTERK